MCDPDCPCIGVSSCLLGNAVRHDGGHKFHRFIARELPRHFTIIEVCPEVELGLGIPREPIHVVQRGEEKTLVGTESKTDWTQPMAEFASKRVSQMKQTPLDGFVLKWKSPSCGIDGVNILVENVYERTGQGLFAAELIRQCPGIPIVQERDLDTKENQVRFIEQVYRQFNSRQGNNP